MNIKIPSAEQAVFLYSFTDSAKYVAFMEQWCKILDFEAAGQYNMYIKKKEAEAVKTKGRLTRIDDIRPCYNAEADRKENFIGRRIAEGRAREGLSLAEFSRALARRGVDVGISAINKWEKGGSAPNAYQLLAISEVLGVGSVADYFMSSSRNELNEEGLKKLSDYRADLVASGRYRPRRAVPAPIEYIDMPVSSLTVSAGTGAFLDSDSFETVSFPADTVPEGAQFGVRVSGDSMEPVYHDGQIVWVRRCERLAVGEVGIFVYDGEGYLKVYGEQEPANTEDFTDSYGDVRPQPVMISYNKAYEPRAVSAHTDFCIVGRVL